MFSREKSLSVRVPVDLQPSGHLHNMWVYLYSVSSRTGTSAISRLITEAEIHSRHQGILSAVRRHQILCAFLSCLLKPVFDVAMVSPGDEMWTTAVVLGTVGTIHFMQMPSLPMPVVMSGRSGTVTSSAWVHQVHPCVTCADREPLTAPEAYSFSAITNYLLFTSVSKTCLYPVLCSVTIKVHQTASTLECKIWGKFMSLGHGHSVGSRINSPLSSLSQGSCFCVDSGSSAFSMTGLQGLIKDILYNAIKYVFYVGLQLPP